MEAARRMVEKETIVPDSFCIEGSAAFLSHYLSPGEGKQLVASWAPGDDASMLDAKAKAIFGPPRIYASRLLGPGMTDEELNADVDSCFVTAQTEKLMGYYVTTYHRGRGVPATAHITPFVCDPETNTIAFFEPQQGVGGKTVAFYIKHVDILAYKAGPAKRGDPYGRHRGLFGEFAAMSYQAKVNQIDPHFAPLYAIRGDDEHDRSIRNSIAELVVLNRHPTVYEGEADPSKSGAFMEHLPPTPAIDAMEDGGPPGSGAAPSNAAAGAAGAAAAGLDWRGWDIGEGSGKPRRMHGGATPEERGLAAEIRTTLAPPHPNEYPQLFDRGAARFSLGNTTLGSNELPLQVRTFTNAVVHDLGMFPFDKPPFHNHDAKAALEDIIAHPQEYGLHDSEGADYPSARLRQDEAAADNFLAHNVAVTNDPYGSAGNPLRIAYIQRAQAYTNPGNRQLEANVRAEAVPGTGGKTVFPWEAPQSALLYQLSMHGLGKHGRGKYGGKLHSDFFC